MKKCVLKLLPIVLGVLLVLPSPVLAKENKEPLKISEKVNNVINLWKNAQWNRFEVNLKGEDGQGEITIIDNSPVFDYKLVSNTDNGDLSNGDTIQIAVINPGGHVIKTLYYPITRLGEEETRDEGTIVLNKTNQDLGTTYGALRFLNFNNLGSGAEVYLTNDQDKLGTTHRTSINFYRGTTTNNENPYGDWKDRNKVRFGYDSDEGTVWVELDAEYKYRAEYDTVKNANFNTIQFMLLNRKSSSVVRLENMKLNGQAVADTVLVGQSDWPKWNLEGDLQNSQGNFTLEADLVITGDQPSNELNKVELIFGNK